MKKKMNSILTALALAGFAVFLTAEGAKAFCIHNNTADIVIGARQTEGGNFHNDNIDINTRACCSWQEKSCNQGGERDSIVRLDVYYQDRSGQYYVLGDKYICRNVPIKAGGWLAVTGREREGYKCEVYFEETDHRVY